ncbi:MAG: VOC family protein [Clostridia bacterium]|nr:VOC family protein [Clostridia bacterium]
MKFAFDHTNLNVSDLQKSLIFYSKALGLFEQRRKEASDFTLVFLTDGVSDYKLELTYLKNHNGAYDLGENETHMCFRVDDYQAAHALHEEMGCICYENVEMGLYFINDPDGHWIEIVPPKI